MFIHSLEIRGFMGASFDEGLKLSEFGNITLLVGPNNSGKSLPYRALQRLRLSLRDLQEITSRLTTNPGDPLPGQDPRLQMETQFWFKEQTDRDIFVTATFDASQIPTYLQSGNSRRFFCRLSGGIRTDLEMRIRRQSNSRFDLIVNPMCYLEEGSFRYCKDSSKPLGYQVLEKDGIYKIATRPGNFSSNGIDFLALTLLSHLRFFDSTRTTLLNADNSGGVIINGSSLTEKLIKLLDADDRSERQQLESVLDSINGVLMLQEDQRFTSFHVDRQAKPQISLFDGQGFKYHLSNLGSGVEALVILITDLLLEKNGCTYFLEEPEQHMHPGLAARFIQFLKSSCSQHQFIISTHSHTLLDCLGKDDRVYRFRKTAEGECIAELCKEFTDYHRTLDLLGVRASSLLQVNSVIWVEGPSDIEYLRGWMEAIGDAEPSKRLVENSDYAFVIYGGSNIAHLTAGDLDGGESNQIHMLKICRRAALVADRDGGDRAELKEHVKRLKKEFKKHASARVFITQDREIENELPSEVLRQALKATFPDKLKEFPLDSFTPTNDDRIPAQIQALKPGHKLGTKKNEWDTLYNRRKTSLAAKAVEIIKAGSHSPPPYIADLVDFILKGREPETAGGQLA